RAREVIACLVTKRLPHTEAMGGSPLKRQRSLGVRRNDGSITAFPYMPRVADLPADWRHFSTAQKIEHFIGLDPCYQVLSWGPITELAPVRRSMQMQVMRVLLPIGLKAALDGSLDRELTRERNRAAALDELNRKLGAKGSSRKIACSNAACVHGLVYGEN